MNKKFSPAQLKAIHAYYADKDKPKTRTAMDILKDKGIIKDASNTGEESNTR